MNNYILWFSGPFVQKKLGQKVDWYNTAGHTRFGISGENLHELAETLTYSFDVEEVITNGESFIFDNFGVIIGGCYVEEDEI